MPRKRAKQECMRRGHSVDPFNVFFFFFQCGAKNVERSGFKDFLLKPELLRAIVDCGFEHPSEAENHKWKQLFFFVFKGNTQ